MLDRLSAAVEFAIRAHGGQTRKGKDVPYITHPLAVALSLARAGCAEDVVIAGLLHDVVEDTSVTLEEVRDHFGPAVAEIVAACSEDKRLPWEERKARMLETLTHAPLAVKLVACADKLHNIRDLRADYEQVGDRVWDRFNRGRQHQEWYYRGLLDAFAEEIRDGIYPTLFRALAEEVEAQFGGTHVEDAGPEG
ncbi:MAG: phosphohydrolase [Bacillota bacterium]|nr:phosphohydrolase [Bacillota bacterium]REJ37683.1 MAG: phosphohydrolase [Bacillota bacterium]